jgi:hypothetical protein
MDRSNADAARGGALQSSRGSRRSASKTTRIARIVYSGACLAVVLLFGVCALAVIALACAGLARRRPRIHGRSLDARTARSLKPRAPSRYLT